MSPAETPVERRARFAWGANLRKLGRFAEAILAGKPPNPVLLRNLAAAQRELAKADDP